MGKDITVVTSQGIKRIVRGPAFESYFKKRKAKFVMPEVVELLNRMIKRKRSEFTVYDIAVELGVYPGTIKRILDILILLNKFKVTRTRDNTFKLNYR